jgi:transposase
MFTAMDEWTEIRRRVLVDGVSHRQIQRETGLHWQTLKKVLEHSEPPGYRQEKARPKRKLGPHEGWIAQVLKEDREAPFKQRHTASRIFERLRDERGYAGGYTAVRERVKELTSRNREVFVPLSHPPGEAQVDFGHALVNEAGRQVLLDDHLPVQAGIPGQIRDPEAAAAEHALDDEFQQTRAGGEGLAGGFGIRLSGCHGSETTNCLDRGKLALAGENQIPITPGVIPPVSSAESPSLMPEGSWNAQFQLDPPDVVIHLIEQRFNSAERAKLGQLGTKLSRPHRISGQLGLMRRLFQHAVLPHGRIVGLEHSGDHILVFLNIRAADPARPLLRGSEALA